MEAEMYKLLIADDDEIICRGLGTCIPWETYGIQVSAMVYDGEMALACVERDRPHIVIVDINMPFLDGIEFSYAVRQKYPEIKIILLTAYKEFEYAKKAVQMQVFEYLTKPFTNEEVADAVRRAASAIAEEEQYRHKIQKNLAVIREQQLAELTVYGTENQEESRQNIILPEKIWYQVGVLYLKWIRDLSKGEKEQIVENEVALRMAADKVRAISQCNQDWNLFVQNGRIVLVFEHGKRVREQWMRSQILTVMEELGKEDSLFFIFGVGKVCFGPDKLPNSYKEAVYALEQRYGYGNRSIIYYQELYKGQGEYQVELKAAKKHLQSAIQQGDTKQVKEEIDSVFEEIRCMSSWNSSALNFMLMELLNYAYESAEDVEIYKSFSGGFSSLLCEMMNAGSLDELRSIVEGSLKQLYEYLLSRNTTDIQRRVMLAQEYIQMNYSNPELSLNEVAEYVHLSASYLGNSIKKYRNISYINLLNQVRIEQAKRLLAKADVKTYEVAFLVGFNSSQYFSSCFKRTTGMTPGAYREKIYPRIR